MKPTILATLPFSGFYESVHSQEVDAEIERQVEYFQEDFTGELPDFVRDLWETVDYSAVYEKYAQEYAESFLAEFDIDGEFESMDSPQYYNFSTDRVFARITRDALAKIWSAVNKRLFTREVRQQFTSRDGFMSYYDPDWREWGRLSDWDHNQIGTLIAVYAAQESLQGEFGQWVEYEVMEHARGNGLISDWICETSPKYVRALNAMDYLRDRQDRAIRTMADWHAARRAEHRPFEGTPLGQWAT